MDYADILHLNSLLQDPTEVLVNEGVLQEAHDFVIQFPMTTEFVLQRRIGRLFVQAIKNREPWIEKLDYEVLKKIKEAINECIPETKLERQQGGYFKSKSD